MVDSADRVVHRIDLLLLLFIFFKKNIRIKLGKPEFSYLDLAIHVGDTTCIRALL